jgi:hypothetical protein
VLSNTRVRTTHVSALATDIGFGLAVLASNAPERPHAISRLRLHVSTIASFLTGGVLGLMVNLVTVGWLLVVDARHRFA